MLMILLIFTVEGRGLWKVTREVLNIFTAAEARFLDFTDNVKNIIDSKEIVFNLKEN